MREVLKSQMKFREVAIDDIEFDIRSRDEIPKLLIGLQAIHDDLGVRNQVFAALRDLVPAKINPNNGRSGMDQPFQGSTLICFSWRGSWP